MVGEVEGIEMRGVRIAGRGRRERGDRRLEVKVDSKRWVVIDACAKPSLSKSPVKRRT